MFNYISRRPAPGAQRDNGNRNAGAPPMHELGAMLRKRREAMGATLAEVEAATKIRQKYLAALEADEWQLLPGEVVGRGFLRNYAAYLALDATEMIERRRAVADPSLASVLSSTSAGAPLPPQRNVDYRPKDMPLHDEPDGIEDQRRAQPGPFLAWSGVILVSLLLIWTLATFGDQLFGAVAGMAGGMRDWTTAIVRPPTPTLDASSQFAANSTLTPQALSGAVQAPDTPAPTPVDGSNPTLPDNTTEITSTEPISNSSVVILPTATPLAEAQVAPTTPPEAAPTNTPEAAPLPTETPTLTPTPTETPVALPTETPTEIPTETPTIAAPVVVAPACPDARAVLLTPGEGQVVSGEVPITGRATHEAFQFYKLEFAPAGTENFVYFGGSNNIIDGGQLGSFSSGSVPNGVYAIRLTVVDQTANFPPPCQVNVTVQN